ncbi:MAG: hypothetical protein AAF447_07365 [Myxococcota bacterium]
MTTDPARLRDSVALGFGAAARLAVLLCVACGGSSGTTGTVQDQGMPADASSGDQGVPDGGAADEGVMDAGADMDPCVPADEVCNGLDDSCSGIADDGLDCAVGPGTGADGDATVDTPLDLSTDPRAGGTTGWAVRYAVTALSGAQVTVGEAALGLAPGDEVLLINLRGDPDDDARVGTFETGYVDGVEGGTVTLRAPVVDVYGRGGSNADLTGQSVMLQRVPQFDTLTVGGGGVLTTAGFDGATGGVLFVRARVLEVAAGGRVDVRVRGYRGTTVASNGRMGLTGESVSGQPVRTDGLSPESNAGAGQGGTSDCDVFNCTTQTIGAGGGGASFATEGVASTDNGALHAGGAAGAVYGDAALDRLFLGSGGGGGSGGVGGPGTQTPGGGGAGIGALFAASLDVAGAVEATGQQGVFNDNCGRQGSGGGGGGSGGTVWLAADTLRVGAGAVLATGGAERCNGGGAGGDGRVRFDAGTLNGEDVGSPAAVAAANAASEPDPGALNAR